MHVNAFSLTGSARGDGYVSPTGCLIHDDGEKRWTITMEWTDLPLLNPKADNPTEFLYSVLWSMMSDFDDHLVTTVTVDPSPQLEA